ncbi:MAG TPA: acyl-CoA reductase, partial [Herpetosiphonaceae bacterium]|nr:acyl-CoA reductase [Herpetosiphonaceae bacterium]
DHVVARMVEDWRADRLWARLRAAFPEPAALDGWVAYGGQDAEPLLTRAWGPRLTLHVCAGNVPGVAIQSLLDALLVKSPSLVKVASGEPLWAAAWAAMLAEELPILAESLAVLWWPGGSAALEAAALEHAEALIANASAATVADLRRRLPARVRLLDYGSRISFAVVCREALAPGLLPELAAGLAYDAAVFEQQGCVSPQLVFVEDPAPDLLAALAAAIDRALERLDGDLPRMPGAGAAAQARRLRDDLEWRELAGEPVAARGPADGRWTIICDPAAPFAPGPGGRAVLLRPLADLAALPAMVEPFAPFLQSAALAAPPHRRVALAALLAEAGVTRVARVGRQGWPSPLWHHDGRDPLGALVRWTDLE